MGKSKSSRDVEPEPPKKRGRQAGAKTYSKQTLYKLINQYKPSNMVLWGTVAEQYRIQCGELEFDRQRPSKRFFSQKCAIVVVSPLATPVSHMTSL